jgi:hypothetical protein
MSSIHPIMSARLFGSNPPPTSNPTDKESRISAMIFKKSIKPPFSPHPLPQMEKVNKNFISAGKLDKYILYIKKYFASFFFRRIGTQVLSIVFL